MNITAFSLGQRFVGVKEVVGTGSNPMILGMLRLDGGSAQDDAVPWCSAWVNYIAWLLRLPRSKSLAARSWLRVGTPIALADARPENDVVILSRGAGVQPSADVIAAPGHVGFYAGADNGRVLLLGGNQGDGVCVEAFDTARILGVRRLG